ncbi:winged helix-turn-helix domain-containing protein [Nonomuraea sp. 10N515B]|uniref:winged helix-turn-helix domain-containing protein n=1 Tax=Nonomuraea sp. 10N515B TaxID=3457422 RepID=UPI003FCE78B3
MRAGNSGPTRTTGRAPPRAHSTRCSGTERGHGASRRAQTGQSRCDGASPPPPASSGRSAPDAGPGQTPTGQLFHAGYAIEGVGKLLHRHGWSVPVPVRRASNARRRAITTSGQRRSVPSPAAPGILACWAGSLKRENTQATQGQRGVPPVGAEP